MSACGGGAAGNNNHNSHSNDDGKRGGGGHSSGKMDTFMVPRPSRYVPDWAAFGPADKTDGKRSGEEGDSDSQAGGEHVREVRLRERCPLLVVVLYFSCKHASLLVGMLVPALYTGDYLSHVSPAVVFRQLQTTSRFRFSSMK